MTPPARSLVERLQQAAKNLKCYLSVSSDPRVLQDDIDAVGDAATALAAAEKLVTQWRCWDADVSAIYEQCARELERALRGERSTY